jgi:hypothetical protein
MNALSLHLATLVPLTLVAGMLMARAGTQKKMLSWKHVPRRCPICGAYGRHECRGQR